MNKQLAARAEAAAWITRLHGPNRTADMEAGFRRWLAEAEENRVEFEELTDIWAAVGSLPKGSTPRLERWEHSAESQELQQLRGWMQQLPNRGRTINHGWRYLGSRAVAALIVLSAVLVLTWSLLHTPNDVLYATNIGESRMVQLADRSRVWMNSGSRLRVSFDHQQRRVDLLHGEAYFEVAKNASLPFVVSAGGRYVTALGTSFEVRHEPDRTAVMLVEGKVAVSASSDLSINVPVLEQAIRAKQAAHSPVTGNGPWILDPGERLTLNSGAPPVIDAPDSDAVLAWRDGKVVLNDTPILDAVAEMNRYDKMTIVVDDPGMAALTISGLYRAGDNEGFAKSIAKIYQLDVESRDNQLRLRAKPKAP